MNMGHIWKGYVATVFVVLTSICLVFIDYDNSAASTTTGTVWAWGYNGDGELGNGTATDSYTPVQASGISGVTAVAAGAAHSLAVQSGGKVWAWGDNSFGQLGNGTGTDSDAPVQVSSLSGVFAVAAGYYHSLAVQSGGTVWAWGDNINGELGNGSVLTYIATPVQVSGLGGVIAVATGGYHSLALKYDGTVWAWGYNGDGELGNGTTTDSNTPVQVGVLSGVVAIAAGEYHSIALESDGTVWTWGNNYDGQLGNGTTTNSTTPVQVSGLSGAVGVAGGQYHSLALQSGGSVWAWGFNGDGELGNGLMTDTATPVQVSDLGGVFAVASGEYHNLAIQSSNVFSDIPAGYYFEQYIDAIYSDGITTGCQNGTIYLNCAPDGSDNVWRDQMAAFLIRALYGSNYTPICNGGLDCSVTSPIFNDVSLQTDPIFFPYIQKLSELGITNSPGGEYNPFNTVTRGEMAAFLVRALQVRAGQPPLSAPYYTQTPYFTDVPSGTTFFVDVQRLKDLGITTVTGTYGVGENVTRDEMAAFIARAFLGMH